MQRAFPSYLADDASDASRLTGEVFQHLGIDPDASRYLALPGVHQMVRTDAMVAAPPLLSGRSTVTRRVMGLSSSPASTRGHGLGEEGAECLGILPRDLAQVLSAAHFIEGGQPLHRFAHTPPPLRARSS
jgi:hypothetical protein